MAFDVTIAFSDLVSEPQREPVCLNRRHVNGENYGLFTASTTLRSLANLSKRLARCDRLGRDG